MLSKILSKNDCASCKFCCSFRRQSLWETPIFSAELKEKLEKKYPSAKFKHVGKSSFTVDLIHLYKTDDSEEEVPCPFLGKKGCILESDEKPFDCSIWPLRVVKSGSDVKIVLENTCPAVNRQPFENVQNLVREGLGQKIIIESERNEDMIKEFNPKMMVIVE